MRTLIAKLLTRFKDFEYRHTYVESFEDSFIATQIKVLREQRGLSQTALAERAGMKQSQISPMEDVNHKSWKIRTLRRLARAFDLVLVVRFETFASAVKEIDRFSRESLERDSFDDDERFGQPVAANANRVLSFDRFHHGSWPVVQGTTTPTPSQLRLAIAK